jgi:hypothetical protein
MLQWVSCFDFYTISFYCVFCRSTVCFLLLFFSQIKSKGLPAKILFEIVANALFVARSNLQLCPQRMDLGECPKIHDLALRADYELASKSKDYYYDIDVSREDFLFC